jgi:hypothetical protein
MPAMEALQFCIIARKCRGHGPAPTESLCFDALHHCHKVKKICNNQMLIE